MEERRETRSGFKKQDTLQVQLFLVAALPGTAIFALRLIYEQTIMTWQEGDPIKTARFLLSKGADVGLAPECTGNASLLRGPK